MSKYEEPKLAEIRGIDVVVQQVVINNQVQNILGKAYAIVCPQCGRVIYQFPVEVNEVTAYKAKQEGRDELLKIATYCPTCGTKLFYGSEMVDGEVEIKSEEIINTSI